MSNRVVHFKIESYHQSLSETDRAICEALKAEIERVLFDGAGKVWHGHPVWFLEGNPVVGYSVLKDSVQLLFWSGQSFAEEGLKSEGSFKASAVRYTKVSEINIVAVKRWLTKSREIQWDYKNIVKRKGILERLK